MNQCIAKERGNDPDLDYVYQFVKSKMLIAFILNCNEKSLD